MTTATALSKLAASLAADPWLARLALATAWHPDFSDKELADLKRQIRSRQAAI